MDKIDFGFVARVLGEHVVDVRVSTDRQNAAGLRLGRELDLGRMRESDLRRLPMPSSLQRKLTPYLGKTGAELQAAWRWQKLRMTSDERGAVLAMDNRRRLERFAAQYLGASANHARRSFGSLPSAAQTALAALCLSSGEQLATARPEVWAASARQDWAGASAALGRTGRSAIIGRLLASAA